MSTPFLQKYIYNHGTEEVIKRGKKIFFGGGVQVLKIDEVSTIASFRVRNDLYHNYYTVTIARFEDEQNINIRCQCPYNMGEICRHEVAALFHLHDMMLTQQYKSASISHDQSLTIIRMRQIELNNLRIFASDASYKQAEELCMGKPARIISAADERVQAVYELPDGEYHVSLKRNDDKTYNTSCNCVNTQHVLCVHKTALFLQLVNSFGSGYFDSIRNWDSQKNKLLQLYGYTLTDNLEGKFEFEYINERPILKVLDASIKKVNAQIAPLPTKPVVNTSNNYTSIGKQKNDKPATQEAGIVTRLGVVVDCNEKKFPYFAIHIIEGDAASSNPSKFLGTIKQLDISKYVSPDKYTEADRNLITSARKIMPQEVNKYIAKHSHYGDMWDSIIDDELVQNNMKLWLEFVTPKLQHLFALLGHSNRLFLLPQGKKFVTAQLQPLTIEEKFITPLFKATQTDNGNEVSINMVTGSTAFNYSENELHNPILYKHNATFYLIEKAGMAIDIEETLQAVKKKPWAQVLQEHLLPLGKKYAVDIASDAIEHVQGDVQGLQLFLQESGEYFVIKPVFIYQHNVEAFWNQEKTINTTLAEKLLIISRDTTTEQEWIVQLLSLNTHFKQQHAQHALYLHAQYAFKGNWFFQFFEKLKEWKVSVYGYEHLRRFKVKSQKPNTSIHIASGVDWFDTSIQVQFDEQTADIDEIKKALAVKRNYVQLQDGSYGLLPEEWLSKYSLLFKMADVSNNKLRISKYNFSVIDELYDMIDDETLQQELLEKKQNLLQLSDAHKIELPLPSGVDAVLRPYQASGFNWLAYLHKVGWGGLLADDMGLGKTVQTLTFLQYFKEQHGKVLALVVCPTTLLYNWQQELKKFTPQLTYHVHHGTTRSTNVQELSSYNVIITTYGTLRSDIALLMKADWDSAILDESQAIKNPSSKVTKAAMLLTAKHKIALSGTPMQNNTFDIYAQLHFLNPGMLGNKDFFKDNFATPIDKFQEATTKEHLRKLIYPFLLRRTKEQVAKDLPDKTEITLYCEMEAQQRKIYDAYKNMYRAQILGTIQDQGIERSQLAILQGLMKLRQICDSPAILKEDVQLANHSVKLDELVRELQENIGEHKVLVFSQFLGMLALIKEKLTQHNIQFEYFDGSYTAKQRESAINNFQNNTECRVFLISLKAGGTGLNLTAADYVYIMDPWWNPAVEQQAIDRTHRIGQTKNIFAYRYICKDTVEEKIVELKQRKSSLVRDIVADDDGFVKTLSRSDVEYLFS